MIVATYSTITNAIYSYFFYNKFNKNTPDTSNFFFGKKLDPVPSLKKLLSSKINFSWETLTLLSQANNEIFFNFLSAMADTEKPTTYFGFFAQSFYKLTFFMNLEIPKHSLPTIKSKISNLMIFQDSYFHEISFNTCCNVMPFWSNANINLFQNAFSLLNIYKTQFAPKQQKFLFWKNSNWNLSTTFLENNKYENDAILKSNIFYFSNFNLNLIKKFQLQHFFDFTNSLTKQLNFFKWNRWLSKYSIFHKNVFKVINKLNYSKTLLNSTSLNIDLTRRNIWVSTVAEQTDSASFLRFNNKLNFSNLLENITLFINKATDTINNFKKNNIFMKNNENSFFFFLKRFFLYNTLKTNNSQILPYKNTPPASSFNRANNNFNDNKIVMSNTLTILNYLSDYQNFSKKIIKTKLNMINFTKKDTTSDLKDLFLKWNSTNLLNSSNLFILKWLTTANIDFHTKNPTFFNYLAYQQNEQDLVESQFYEEKVAGRAFTNNGFSYYASLYKKIDYFFSK